jgi:hypothetical protein
MISAWITIIATFVLILCIAMVTQSYRRNLRVANECADQFIKAVDDMARSEEYPQELMQHLYVIGSHVDSTSFAMRVCFNFKKMKQDRTHPPENSSDIMRAFDRLAYGQKVRFMEVIGLFLGSLCYRDPLNGGFMRRALLSGSRDRAIREETLALEDMCRHDGGLAHA